MKKEDIKTILLKYELGISSEKENKLIEEWYDSLPELGWDLHTITDANSQDKIQRHIHRKITPSTSFQRLAPFIGAAAAILIVMAATFFLLRYNTKTIVVSEELATTTENVSPGGNKATLVLSDGKTLVLDGHREELILSDSTLSYADGTTLTPIENIAKATLKIPRGGQYKVVLSDGTKVFLNSESTLEYPTRFAGNERKVNLQGEAYFDVIHDSQKPFRVETAQQNITVLGTRFNIRTYEETEKTTLVSGKVAVQNNSSKQIAILKPGQLAQVDQKTTYIRHVDPEEYISWTAAKIVMTDARLQDVTEELARWYDVDFIFPAHFVNNEQSYIHIDRQLRLSSVLEALELLYHVKFSIRGKEVYIQGK